MESPVCSNILLPKILLSVSESGLSKACPKHFLCASLNNPAKTRKSNSSIKTINLLFIHPKTDLRKVSAAFTPCQNKPGDIYKSNRKAA
jgi:hypothetical protein